jgi:hypothetical protein
VTDLEDRRARGFRAKAALDEFFVPACEGLRGEYLSALTKLAANEPWETAKITKLAVAQRVIDAVEQQLRAAILDGELAAKDLSRAQKIERIPEAKRKALFGIGV